MLPAVAERLGEVCKLSRKYYNGDVIKFVKCAKFYAPKSDTFKTYVVYSDTFKNRFRIKQIAKE